MKQNQLYFLMIICCMACTTQSETVTAQIAGEKCKFLGNIIARSVPPDFGQHWNQVTPENAGKWGSAERERDVMSWTALDNAYSYARKMDLPFKQHTLVWGQQQPPWITSLSSQEQKEEVEEWIRSYCERYPDTDYIDVVNEPLHAVPSYAEALGGAGSTGWDWVVWSFEKAREYCPNANLVLNDYNILRNDSATAAYAGIVKILKERGLIDIVGEQGHFLETTPLETIQKNLDVLASAGLPVQISEYDVNLADDNAQLQKYQEQFPIFWNHPAIEGVTLWGYRQGEIWRKDAYLIRRDGTLRPAFQWLTGFIESQDREQPCDPGSK